MSTVTTNDAVGLSHVLGRGVETIKAIGRAVVKSLGGAMRTMQMARMLHVLCEMSDEDLKKLGITRQQIPAYAEKLIYENG